MEDHHQSLSFLATTASSAILNSVERILSEETEENIILEYNDDDDEFSSLKMSDGQLLAGVWITRATGIITLVSSICMIWRAWARRSGIFHRLILGMGFHLTIFGIANTVGAAAIPSSATNAMGNLGTVGTCTAQGFLIYFSFMTACMYYGSFSIYSCVGTLSTFENVVGMEKYIHVLVHVYPICSGIYLATLKIFNNSGFGYCFLEVEPIGCGGHPASDEFIPCERGPESHTKAQFLELFWDIPLYLLMVCPTLIMAALYVQVDMFQETIQIPAKEVAKQSAVYLLALYAGVLPGAVIHSLEWSGTISVSANLFSNFMFMLFALFSMMVYVYFTTGDWYATVDLEDDELDESSHHEMLASTDLIFGHLELALRGEGNGSGAIVKDDNAPSSPVPKRTSSSSQQQQQSPRRKSKSRKSSRKSRYSFNIFDGTNASGKFADFIFEGDSEDIRYDHNETEKWNAVQDHI